MEIRGINLVYFSATFSTREVVHYIAKSLDLDILEKYDITQGVEKHVYAKQDELFIIGVPVYGGRVPAITSTFLNSFKGNNTPALIVCVYGNRDYDDALLELKDIVEGNGFKVVSAGAFIAQHSIFPKLAKDRPDEMDKKSMADFAAKSLKILEQVNNTESIPEVKVKGNFPYRETSKIPITPKGNKKCNECGTCVRKCPVHAIEADNPRKTNKEICISCARCIAVCPQHARHFGGLLYQVASKKFVSSHSERKEAEAFYIF